MAKGDWWFKFEFNVWRNDSALRKCSLETKGFWLECICAMREANTATLHGTFAELARLIGCFPEEVSRCVVELKHTNTADVTLGNGDVTLTSRYIARELKSKELTKLRVRKHRETIDVTPPKRDRVRVRVRDKNKEEEKEVEKKPQAALTTRGSRIPEPFFLTSEMRAWAGTKKPDLDLTLETEKFVNYWRAKAGAGGVKLDWLATWKNWILNSYAQPKSNHRGGKRTDAEVIAESADFYANYDQQYPA